MKAVITNFRGLASASLDISKICLLAGPNEAGKTSASQALAAALTGDPVPITGIKKTQAGLLVRSGTANGSVELTGPNGSTHIGWPSAKVKTEGQAPFASHFAVGLQSIVNLDDKERVKVLTEYLKATPTRADLDAQLAGLKLPVNILAQLWDLIEKQGWDNACTQIKDKGARLKGQWEGITGDRYGSKKADSYIPEGYDNELMGQSEATLQAFVTDARDALEAAIAADAVDDSKRADLEALAALLDGRKIDALAADNTTIDPALANQFKECDGYIVDMAGKRDALNVELKALPQPNQATGMGCPDCGAVLHVVNGALVHVAGVLTEEEITARKADIDELTAKIKAVNDAISRHMETSSRIKGQITAAELELAAKRNECKRLVQESVKAEVSLQEMSTPATGGSSTGISVDDCRTTLARAEMRLKAFKSKLEADLLHDTIQKNADLLAKISPEGIRGDVLAKALKGFNDSLAPFCKAANWRPVTLESDFMPTYGGTIYLLLSESAKFRVRTILSMGMALKDGSQALIIDAADILDKGGRNGLFKAVKAAGLPALVAMTIDKYSDKEFPDRPESYLVPNLAKAGIGASYWLNGEAVAEVIQ